MDELQTQLVAFVQARLTEEELLARMANGDQTDWMREWLWGRLPDGRFINRGGIRWSVTPGVDGAHINAQSPERILRDVDGKRSIVTGAVDVLTHSTDKGVRGIWVELLRNLAWKYVDHPDFDTEWTPN